MRLKLLGGVAMLLAAGGCYDDGREDASTGSEVSGVEVLSSDGWSIQALDSAPGAGMFHSIAYTGSGLPAVSYSNSETGELKLARWNGSAWSLETVFTSSTWEVVQNSMAFNPAGNPAIAFLTQRKSNPGDDGLSFAEWTGSSWAVKEVDPNGDHSYVSLAYDGSGKPCIAYRTAGSPGKLHIARRNNNSWSKELVDSSFSGPGLSLAFDPSGKPAIAYRTSGPTLKFAAKPGSSWIKSTIETGDFDDGFHPAIAFNPATGQPSIVHGRAFPPFGTVGRRFVHWTGSTWVGETILTTASDGVTLSGSLAFDAAGSPFTAFMHRTYGSPQCTVQFASRASGAWLLETVDSSATVVNQASVGFRNGVAAVVYNGDNTLKIAQRMLP